MKVGTPSHEGWNSKSRRFGEKNDFPDFNYLGDFLG